MHDRHAGSIEAACHVRGVNRRAMLSDVSNYGCRATMVIKGTRPGDRILVQLGSLLVLPATVAWVHESQVGLEFASPMMGSMLNQYILRHGKRGNAH
jgi:hypothetical protein